MRKLLSVLATLAIGWGLCAPADAQFLIPFQAIPGGGGPPPTCVNSGTSLCMILGSYNLDPGSTSWMGRPWDFTGALILQDQCSLNYPIEGGADNPPQSSSLPTYQQESDANFGCPNSIYAYRTQNEWWLNCTPDNPWYPSNCFNEGAQPSMTPQTYIADTCAMVSYIRNAYPGVKVYWYGPGNDTEAQYDPSGTCQIDAYEAHIYLVANGDPNRTGKGDWQGGTPFSCGSTPNGTLPNDIQCSTSTPLGYLANYAADPSRKKPIVVSEWCSTYNDTASPDGDDYGTWAIANWMKANNVVSAMHWSGDPGGGVNDCTITNNTPHIQSAMNHAFGGTHYAGTFFNYITLPSPNPYP